jgi:anti-sigma factor RsiW
MTCDETRLELHDLRRGRLEPGLAARVERHLDACTACRGEAAAEDALDVLLRERLPHPAAPAGLRRRLEAEAAASASPGWGPASGRWSRVAVPALAALAAGLILAVPLAGLLVERQVGGAWTSADRGAARLEDEAISDHLRVLVSQQPVEIASGGPHQVKPWFEGRLDFAPMVPLPPTPDLALRGGAVGWVLDRPAAVLQYRLRLHAVTLLAFRAEGLAGLAEPRPGQAAEVRLATRRGFGVALWRSGEIGYALVSDIPALELHTLAETMGPATVR